MSERKSIPERLGHDFLRALYHTINTVRMYQDNNQLVQNSVLAFTALLNELTGLPYWPSYLIALVLSVIWNLTFNRRFTFRSSVNMSKAMALVLAYYAVFTPLSTWWGDALTGIGWNEYLVLGGTMVINLITEYLFQRLVVFRGTMNTNDAVQRGER